MAVSANSTRELSRDQIITTAYRLAGLKPVSGEAPDADEISAAADFFELELDELEAKGPIQRAVERATQALTDGTAEYTLASTVVDVQFPCMIKPTSGGETVVERMSLSEYMTISDKATEGTPTRMYVEKHALVKLVLWPIPDDSTLILRYQRVRLLYDVDSGTVTTDLARKWTSAIAHSVGSKLALSANLDMGRVMYLQKQADAKYEALFGNDRARGNWQLVPYGRR